MSTRVAVGSQVLRATTKSIFFRCSKCNLESDAPIGTQRSSQFVCRKCYGRGKDKRPRELNNLTGAEWARASRSIEAYPDVRSLKQRQHGACFPQSLAEEQIRIYTQRGERVLDPFLGVGTALDAALALGRTGVGVEINREYAALARKELVASGYREGKHFKIHTADARNLLNYIAPSSVDFVITSPPYSSLLKNVKGHFAFKWREHSLINPVANPRPYSSKPEDLGNMPYAEYLGSISDVLSATFHSLKPGSYAAWVVKDFRDLRNRIPYVNLHGDVIARAQKAGFQLWDIRVFDQTKFRPLVCLGFPSRNFYLNIGHSYILIFKKPGER